MYDFEKLKPSAFKNKYDVAFETEKSRITYGELLDKVNAMYNSLSNMGVEGSALLLSDCHIKTAICSFALSKCGVRRILADSKTPCIRIEEIVRKYSPSVVFLNAGELKRLYPVLDSCGIKKAVVFGKSEPLFAAQFDYDSLMDKNDYLLVKEYSSTSEIRFYDNVTCVLPKLSQYDLKGGVSVDFPAFCKPAVKLLSDILYSGGKCCVFMNNTAKMHKKKKTVVAITDKSRIREYVNFPCEVFETEFSVRRVGNSFFDSENISKKLTKLAKMQVRVVFNGAVFNVTVVLPQKADTSNLSENLNVSIARQSAIDLLYPFDKKKTFAIKQQN